MTTITTEKTTNYILRPVLKTRAKKQFPYVLESVDSRKDGKLEISSYWTAKHHMMLDVITNELLRDFEKRTNRGNIYTTHYAKKIKEEAEKITAEDLEYFSFRKNFEDDRNAFMKRLQKIRTTQVFLHERELLKQYDFLRDMTSNQIFTLLNEMVETRFRCTFRVKMLTDKKDRFTHYRYYMWLAEPLFNLTDWVVEKTNHDPPRIKLRNYMVKFEGVLGRLFAHNVKTLNVIHVPVEIYDLSQDPQFIYRRFVSTMIIPKDQETSIKFKVASEDVEKYMNMKVDHSTYKRNRIGKALEELASAGFIEFHNNRMRTKNDVVYDMVRLK